MTGKETTKNKYTIALMMRLDNVGKRHFFKKMMCDVERRIFQK